MVAQPPAPTVVTTSPTDGARLAALPAFIDVTFSEGVRVDSVSATDLTIDGGATVTEVQALDGRTFRFAMLVPDVPNVDTTYAVTLSAGAISDLQSNTNATFTGAFIVDHVGPRIIAQTPAMLASSPGTRSPSHSASRSTGQLHVRRCSLDRPKWEYPDAGPADAYTATILLQASNLHVATVMTDPIGAAGFGQLVRDGTQTIEQGLGGGNGAGGPAHGRCAAGARGGRRGTVGGDRACPCALQRPGSPSGLTPTRRAKDSSSIPRRMPPKSLCRKR